MAANTVNTKREINGVFYLALAVILGVAFYLPAGRSGWIGQVLLNGGRGLFGVTALALPALFAYMAIDYLLEKDMSVTRRRFTYVLILMIGSAAMLHLLTTDLQAVRAYSLAAGERHQAWRARTTAPPTRKTAPESSMVTVVWSRMVPVVARREKAHDPSGQVMPGFN